MADLNEDLLTEEEKAKRVREQLGLNTDSNEATAEGTPEPTPGTGAKDDSSESSIDLDAAKQLKANRKTLSDALEQRQKDIDSGELASLLARGLTKFGAAMYGAKKGIDMSNIDVETPNWDKRRELALGEYGRKMTDAEKEADLANRLAIANMKAGQPKAPIREQIRGETTPDGHSVFALLDPVTKKVLWREDSSGNKVTKTIPYEKDFRSQNMVLGNQLYQVDKEGKAKAVDLPKIEVAPGIKINPIEEPKYTKIVDSVQTDPDVKKLRMAHITAQQAKEALKLADQETSAYSTFQGLMAQLAQGGGQRLSDQDIKQFGTGDQSLLGRIKQWGTKQETGLMDAENKASFSALIDALETGNDNLIKDRVKEIARSKAEGFTPFRGQEDKLYNILVGKAKEGDKTAQEQSTQGQPGKSPDKPKAWNDYLQGRKQ